MLVIEVGAAEQGGYVRAFFSRRARGFVAPLDLMRAQLGAAVRLARRRRLRAAFSDYLVSDGCADDAALRSLEMYAGKYERKAARAPFSERRAWYSGFNDVLLMTGARWPLEIRYRLTDGGPLDAPELMPGGGCDELGALFGGSPQVVALREPVEIEAAEAFAPGRGRYAPGVDIFCSTDSESLEAPESIAAGSCKARRRGVLPVGGRPAQSFVQRAALVSVAPFAERREHWRGHVEGMRRYWGTASHVERERGALREGFDCGAIDAPVFIPGGAALWSKSAGGFVGSVVLMRGGVWR